MNHDTMQLLLKWDAKLLGILPHPIHTNHDITRDKVADDIIERNDIGICIMIQILPVHTEKIIVVTKQIRNIANRLSSA